MQSGPLGVFSQSLEVEELTNMNLESIRDFSPIYSAWFDIPVLLFVLRQCHVPIPCSIVGESAAAVLIQLQPGWEIEVPKEFILAVEEATARLEACMN
jgi:hypothetical protein